KYHFARLIDVELGSLDEVREVRLHEGEGMQNLRVATQVGYGQEFRRAYFAQRQSQRFEQAQPVEVVGLGVGAPQRLRIGDRMVSSRAEQDANEGVQPLRLTLQSQLRRQGTSF